MKLWGVALLSLSGLLAGLLAAARLRRRARLLLELRDMAQCFATGIRWSGASLGELILERQDLRICRLAEAAPEFPDHPAAALEQAGRRVLWEPGDLGWMRGFARGLGVSDTQGQLEHLRLYQDLLEPRLRAAVETAQRKCRLYVAMGLFGGTLLGLVLL